MTLTDLTVTQTVLVADDDPDIVALMARRLERAGYHVITASDGQQALELIEACLPQLAVLDVMMPKLTGIGVMELLRDRPETRGIPVILISAAARAAGIGAFADSGADDYIKKPFGPQELRIRVQSVLSR